ncbi:hypothetical protein WME95_34350 [Sorangium sp. So ce327]|uniref:hypothetical protein n=1 Tax=Sorangium sp. So ce327 TaxID=3133301 RepID=UPI003F61AB12
MRSLVLVGAPFIFVAGCGGSDGDIAEPTEAPATPSTPAEVDTTYEQIGRGCGDDGSLVRSLAHVAALTTNNLWIAPDNDAAGLAASKDDNGWGASVGVYELGFESSGDNMESHSAEQAARCDAASEIFSPIGDGARQRFLNVLVYAGDHAHAEAMPAEGLPAVVETPVRLKGYLDVAEGTREEIEDGVVYRDAQHQYLPIYVRCEKPMKITYEERLFSREEVEALKIDTRMCRPVAEDGYGCLSERPLPIEGACTFVAADAKYVTTSGEEHNLSIGGRIERGEQLSYTITVDRFAFH